LQLCSRNERMLIIEFEKAGNIPILIGWVNQKAGTFPIADSW